MAEYEVEPEVLNETQRWYVRTRWIAGESPEALAVEYGVPLSAIEREVGKVQRKIMADTPARVATHRPPEPTTGLKCSNCGTHRYGEGQPSLIPGYLLAHCARCGRTMPHRSVK